MPFKLVVCEVKDIEIIRGVPCWSNPALYQHASVTAELSWRQNVIQRSQVPTTWKTTMVPTAAAECAALGDGGSPAGCILQNVEFNPKYLNQFRPFHKKEDYTERSTSILVVNSRDVDSRQPSNNEHQTWTQSIQFYAIARRIGNNIEIDFDVLNTIMHFCHNPHIDRQNLRNCPPGTSELEIELNLHLLRSKQHTYLVHLRFSTSYECTEFVTPASPSVNNGAVRSHSQDQHDQNSELKSLADARKGAPN